jgi:hypothetical protein
MMKKGMEMTYLIMAFLIIFLMKYLEKQILARN